MKIGVNFKDHLWSAIENIGNTGFEQLVYIVNTEFAQAIATAEPQETNLIRVNLGQGVYEPVAKSQVVCLPDNSQIYSSYFLLFNCFLPLTDCYPIDWSRFGEISDPGGSNPIIVNGLGAGLGQYF